MGDTAVQRQLIVMRHAKSSWDEPSANDHQRPLNDRGRRAASRVAQHLVEIGWCPQHVVSSDAERTRQTAALMLAEWEDGIGVDFFSNLYLAGPDALESELVGVSDEIEVLLALGHNPGWEHVVYKLTGSGVTIKTGTAALLQADCESWSDTFRTDWMLEGLVHPRELE